MRVEDVTTEFVVEDTPSTGRMTVFQLIWRSDDPLAVVMALVSRPDHPALPQGVWVAPRDALRAALTRPVGEGDVRLTPMLTGDDAHAAILLDLVDGSIHSTVVLDAAELRSFLDRTHRVVPFGEEHPESELDELLSELLRT